MNSESGGPEEWIEQTQGMVHSLAYSIHRKVPKTVPIEDLIAYGQLGLVQASQAYRGDQGTSFQTFAYHRIRGAIFDGLGKMAWTNRSAQRRFAAERASHEVLTEKAHDEENAVPQATQPESSAAAAGWFLRTTEKLAVVQLIASGMDDYDTSGPGFEDHSNRPDELVARNELRDKLGSLVNNLPEIERSLIQLTYYEGKSFSEAAAMLGHTKSWASKLHSRILERLAKSANLIDITYP